MPSIRDYQRVSDWESMLKVSGWAPKWPQKHKPARHAPGACAPAPVAVPTGPVPGPLARAAFGPRAQAALHLGRRRTRDVRGLRKIPAGAPSFSFSSGPVRTPLVKRLRVSYTLIKTTNCPAHAHRARASCLPDSNPYGRDGLAHSRSLSTARRALRVA